LLECDSRAKVHEVLGTRSEPYAHFILGVCDCFCLDFFIDFLSLNLTYVFHSFRRFNG
jgi:hypothetical protein